MKKKPQERTNSVGAKIIEGLHEFTEALEGDEDIAVRFTCRTVTLDLVPLSHDRKSAKATRSLLGTSQAVFAQFLGVSVNAVRAWEQARTPQTTLPVGLWTKFAGTPHTGESGCENRLRSSIRPANILVYLPVTPPAVFPVLCIDGRRGRYLWWVGAVLDATLQ